MRKKKVQERLERAHAEMSRLQRMLASYIIIDSPDGELLRMRLDNYYYLALRRDLNAPLDPLSWITGPVNVRLETPGH